MKFTKKWCIYRNVVMTYCFLSYTTLSPGVNAAPLYDEVIINLNVTLTQRPCTISVPSSEVKLKEILVGKPQKSEEFTLSVDCPVPASMGIYPKVLGTMVTGSNDVAWMDGQHDTVKFWFEKANSTDKIGLDGNTPFCIGENNRTCKINPVTLASSTTRKGDFSSTIQFDIRYQ